MESPKKQISDRLNKASNVLVTVSANPSVDQLAAAIGLTLLLNKLGKHATAVFSGQTPSIIEFLQPEKTFEKNTDSLRDFIIALDKSKADKLRYKVEDQMVKIFITPYRTSISDKDLEFSQGDFNVDVVMALGVNDPKDLDQAITSHGRILHDATVVSVNTSDGASLGTINWVQKDASSLCEMLLDVGLELKADALDGQMATAFLTGIVAETDRFSNEKTTSTAMQMSAKLIAAGANQQLIATQLEPLIESSDSNEPEAELPEVSSGATAAAPAAELAQSQKAADGSLEIDHGDKKPVLDINNLPEGEESDEERLEQIDIDKEGRLKRQKDIEAESKNQDDSKTPTASRLIKEPPTTGLGGTLTANSTPEHLDPSTDPLGVDATKGPLLSHTSAAEPIKPPMPESDTLTTPPSSLSELEKAVDSPHVGWSQPAAPMPDGLNAARDAVSQAVQGTVPHILEPVQSLNAHPIDLVPPLPQPTLPGQATSGGKMVDPSLPSTPSQIFPANLVPPKPGLPPDDTAASVSSPTAPPPVPPPMMPPLPPSLPPASK